MRALWLPVCAAAPICAAIVLNSLVRPALAAGIGGAREQTYTGHRSSDGWWEFDTAARAAHPVLTGFLEMTDGAIAVAGLGGAAVCCAALLLAGALSRQGSQR